MRQNVANVNQFHLSWVSSDPSQPQLAMSLTSHPKIFSHSSEIKLMNNDSLKNPNASVLLKIGDFEEELKTRLPKEVEAARIAVERGNPYQFRTKSGNEVLPTVQVGGRRNEDRVSNRTEDQIFRRGFRQGVICSLFRVKSLSFLFFLFF